MTFQRSYFFSACLSFVVGLVVSFWAPPWVGGFAEEVAKLYMNLVKLISVPVLFFSILSAMTQFDCTKTLKKLMGTVLCYTLLTTLLASCVAMGVYIVISPQTVEISSEISHMREPLSYIKHLSQIIPDNMLQMFLNHNIFAIVLSGFCIGIALIRIEQNHRLIMRHFLQAVFAVLMKLAQALILVLPFFVWAFVVILMQEASLKGIAQSLFSYFFVIICANLIQAFIVLPCFLKANDVSVRETLIGAWPALTTAFFTKSSYAAMPTTMHCLIKNLHASNKVVSFVIPLCSTINMNACAAFIYITVLFVAESHGIHLSFFETCLWVVGSTVLAIGNAGVPMGCFFMSSIVLSALDIPTMLMGAILPFYTILDMFETSLNVFSNICVTRVVCRKE